MKWLLLLLSFLSASAQDAEKDRYLTKANTEFGAKNFVDAEANYRISHSKYPNKAAAVYNLGNTTYRINKPAEAKSAYTKAVSVAKTRTEKHRSYHNLGNVFMKEKDYKSAVDAYKEALVNNPSDDQTRYNYALAKKLLKENKPKDDKQLQDKKQGGNQKQDQPAPGKNDSDDKNNPKSDANQQQKQNPKPQQQQSQDVSKQSVKNLLDAVNNEERKVQNKVNSKKAQRKPPTTEKDW